MKCLHPVLIKNKYTNEYMYVPCGKCDACLTSDSVNRSAALANDMLNYNTNLFVTLTYENNYIPFVINGSTGIYRLSSDLLHYDRIEETEKPIILHNYNVIRGFERFSFVPVGKCVGVIYYRDFKLFFKRLRKKLFTVYGKYSNFRFYICCEYGSVYCRPHAHILLQFQERRIAEVAAKFIPLCWQMCDWSRLSDTIKFATGGISSYISAYVNSNSCNCEVSRIKMFRPIRRRSKNLNFGFESKIFEKIKIIVSRYYGEKFPNFDEEDFRYVHDKSVSCVSSRLIPKSYFNSYFRKIEGFHDLSFKSFRLCCYSIYGYFKRKPEDRKYLGIQFILKTQDKVLIKRYENFIKDFGFVDSFETFDNYVTFVYRLFAYYDSLVVKESMKQYEYMTKQEYLTYCYNTFSPKISLSRRRIILRSLGIDVNYIDNSNFYNDLELKKIKDSVIKYKNFLLPKHINSLVNKF